MDDGRLRHQSVDLMRMSESWIAMQSNGRCRMMIVISALLLLYLNDTLSLILTAV